MQKWAGQILVNIQIYLFFEIIQEVTQVEILQQVVVVVNPIVFSIRYKI